MHVDKRLCWGWSWTKRGQVAILLNSFSSNTSWPQQLRTQTVTPTVQHTRQSQQAQVAATIVTQSCRKSCQKAVKSCRNRQTTSLKTKNDDSVHCWFLQIVILVSHWEYTIGVHRNTLHYAVLDARLIQKCEFYLGSRRLNYYLSFNGIGTSNVEHCENQ